VVRKIMPSRKSLNILVAEDDDLIGELLSEMLVEMGHAVCAVTTTEADTVAAAHRFQPDLLIVDFHLNPGSGVDAVDLIMQTRSIPHILVSGNIAKVRELRPDAVMLEKPYNRASLLSAIRRTSEQAQHAT
jgi:CheY-like chemotaxis protein